MAVDRSAERERTNRLMLRARDEMDRAYAEPLDIDALSAIACCSPAHFIRTFSATFGETPKRYLQRRVEAPPTSGAVPTCFEKAWTRPADTSPSSFGTSRSEAPA